MSYSSYGIERGQLIRAPSTANLMLDSADRDETLQPSCWDFQITRSQSLINGYFTRAGTTEVVLEWCEDNINASLGNTIGLRDLSGVQTVVTIPPGKYTVAQALDAIVVGFNGSALGTTSGRTFSVSTTKVPGQVVIDISGTAVSTTGLATFPLAGRLDLGTLSNPTNTIVVICPDLRPYRYIDFTCEQLTAVQDVKDASTAVYNRDVLNRWYFSFDEQNISDTYGFPILMGYTRFCLRRIYNPPKQIKWEQNLPVGNLVFSVYDEDGNLLVPSDVNTNWLMTIQLSEG
jgi:hypothetical protein